LNGESSRFDVARREVGDLPYQIAILDRCLEQESIFIEIEYSCLMDGYRDCFPAFWHGLTSEYLFVRPDEAYYPSPAENVFSDYFNSEDLMKLTVEGPSDWVFSTTTFQPPEVTLDGDRSRLTFSNVRKPPLLVGGRFVVSKSKEYPALEFWTTRQNAESQRTLSFIADVTNYLKSLYGELPNFMLRYIETPKDYNGYVQRPMILMDNGVMDPVTNYSTEEYSSAPSDIQFYVTHMTHEISHLWFPGETITGNDILGLWGESFAHVAESGCILNHFKLPST